MILTEPASSVYIFAKESLVVATNARAHLADAYNILKPILVCTLLTTFNL